MLQLKLSFQLCWRR